MDNSKVYIILRLGDIEGLAVAVNDAIRDGYEPVGGPFLALHDQLPRLGGDFCQAMRLRGNQ
jgi:hypothetical protein